MESVERLVKTSNMYIVGWKVFDFLRGNGKAFDSLSIHGG